MGIYLDTGTQGNHTCVSTPVSPPTFDLHIAYKQNLAMKHKRYNQPAERQRVNMQSIP
jgi:hypothetical protein